MDNFVYSIDLMEFCSRRLILECYTESFKYLCVVEWMRDVEKRQFVSFRALGFFSAPVREGI